MFNTKMNPFRIEDKRHCFATKNNRKEFKKLYSKKYKSIDNKNTGKFWSDINFSRAEKLINSSIYQYKLHIIKKYLINKKGNLLDIGFGNGFIENQISNRNLHLYGIDISKKSVQEIKKRINGIFKTGNILKIPFAKKSFDFILCLDVLEHISPQKTFAALQEISRVMKKNGILIISIPLNEGLEDMIINKNLNPNAHVRIYTPEILKMEVNISGFIIEREFYLTSFRQFFFIKSIINKFIRIRQSNLMIIIAIKK